MNPPALRCRGVLCMVGVGNMKKTVFYVKPLYEVGTGVPENSFAKVFSKA